MSPTTRAELRECARRLRSAHVEEGEVEILLHDLARALLRIADLPASRPLPLLRLRFDDEANG